MTTLDQSLRELVNKGVISKESARQYAKQPENFM